MSKIVAVQQILGVKPDGIWGPISQAALDHAKMSATEFHGKASSFADPRDVESFLRCKATGKSDLECFRVGDNGVGCWSDNTKEGSGPSCAIAPLRMVEKWGSINGARLKEIQVEANGKMVICQLKDRMPADTNKLNPAVIDLNPDAVSALGLRPPIMVDCSWYWV